MYKVVIGLEVHCELKTNSKNFSSAPNKYSTIPNENVSVVDLGLPGILPVVNKEACHKALKMALALNCQTPDEIIFDRKNYNYPDLPKGYQITQVTKPFGRKGKVTFFVDSSEKTVEIHQLHLEEDTASLEHCSNYSLIDYNRSGIPLIEIVTEPCIHSALEAINFLEYLRSVLLYCDVSEARTDKGQMRCDVNISLMKETDTELGTKVEMKNLNAFTSIRSAIEYEIIRQSKILDNGEKVKQETRRIDEDGKTYPMREKVDAVDYKYFIEPNLPPVLLPKEYIEEVKKEIPVLQYERIKKYMKSGLDFYDAGILAKRYEIATYYEDVLDNVNNKNSAANWVITLILGTLNKLEIELNELFLTPKMLGSIINLVDDKKLSLMQAKNILYEAIKIKKDPLDIIKEEHLRQITDKEELLNIVEGVIKENPEQVKMFLEGKDYIINFFTGKIMQKTDRQANPKIAIELVKEQLERLKK